MPRQASTQTIAISGGGFVGMTLALALARAGRGALAVLLIDRQTATGARSPAADPRASALSAASRRLLTALGVWERLEADAQPVTGIDITDTPLDSPIRQTLLHYDNEIGPAEPATHIVPNDTLHAALTQTVDETDGITRHFGETIAGYRSGTAKAELRLGSGAALEAELVVAADGRRSALREAAGIKIIGWDYAQTGIITTVRHERPHGGRAVQHFLPAGPFAILPLVGGHRSSLVWTERTDEARRVLALDDVRFLAEVAQRFGGKLGSIVLDGPRASWLLEMHVARSFHGSRLALAGDAARGVHPLAGQGLNIGLRDVAALTEVVIDTCRLGLDIGGEEPLSRYERWRRFDSVTSAAMMDGLNRLFSNDITLLRSLREVGLGLVDRASALKRVLVREAAGVTGYLPRLLRGDLP